MAGYSGTPLVKKLGIGEGFRILLVNAPNSYSDLLGPLPKNVVMLSEKGLDLDFIHLFVKSVSDLEKRLPGLMKKIKPAGMIWVSWYKKSAGIATDVTENIIRDTALAIGLVDIKVCAVDETWSGLKLVIRRENRK